MCTTTCSWRVRRSPATFERACPDAVGAGLGGGLDLRRLRLQHPPMDASWRRRLGTCARQRTQTMHCTQFSHLMQKYRRPANSHGSAALVQDSTCRAGSRCDASCGRHRNTVFHGVSGRYGNCGHTNTMSLARGQVISCTRTRQRTQLRSAHLVEAPRHARWQLHSSEAACPRWSHGALPPAYPWSAPLPLPPSPAAAVAALPPCVVTQGLLKQDVRSLDSSSPRLQCLRCLTQL